jgi:hypothetical protein
MHDWIDQIVHQYLDDGDMSVLSVPRVGTFGNSKVGSELLTKPTKVLKSVTGSSDADLIAPDGTDKRVGKGVDVQKNPSCLTDETDKSRLMMETGSAAEVIAHARALDEELWQERCGLLEHDGGHALADAELLAAIDTLRIRSH